METLKQDPNSMAAIKVTFLFIFKILLILNMGLSVPRRSFLIYCLKMNSCIITTLVINVVTSISVDDAEKFTSVDYEFHIARFKTVFYLRCIETFYLNY